MQENNGEAKGDSEAHQLHSQWGRRREVGCGGTLVTSQTSRQSGTHSARVAGEEEAHSLLRLRTQRWAKSAAYLGNHRLP